MTDYRNLLDRWDAQQSGYIAGREARFKAVLDVLELACPPDMLVLDLACGPGSLSERILQRFPQARVVGLDMDPLLLAIGRGALEHHGTRLRLERADITLDGWQTAVGDVAPHAAVSSTALHYLLPEKQVRLYREVHDVLAPGGVFMNADHQRFNARTPIWRDWAQRHDRASQEAAWTSGAPDWSAWWDEVRAVPSLAALVPERDAAFAHHPAPMTTIVEFHLAALAQAGFRESGTIWQFLDDYVVVGAK